MGKLRFYLALWAAKSARIAMRLLGRNATYLPGKIALKLCPMFLKYVGKPEKIIAVTGTNGKTTVCNMLCDILEQSGEQVLNNRLGSNVNSGIASSLLQGAGWSGKSKYKIAVFEVDERSSIRIYPYVKPNLLLVTNLFRDSIMRNAHPGYIADILTGSIPKETKLILNADDLISAGISPENERVYFGLQEMETDVKVCINRINDMQICPKCQGKLEYDYLRYHHIGRAHCTDCDFRSPEYDYSGANVNLERMTMDFADKTGVYGYKLPSDSVFNIYNLVAVVSVLRELGMQHSDIQQRIVNTGIVATRYREDKVGNVEVIMQMAKEKNALAGSRAFDYISGQPGQKELILMMNCLGDVHHWSENVCWLYDCDFEFLNRENITRIIATGPRAKDYYLRLLLAGVPEEKLCCVAEEMEAPEALTFTPGTRVYIFYGTDSIGLAKKVREKVCGLAKEAAEK